MKKMNNKGFSLVELIVVVAIMAVLMAVLVPTLIRNVEKTRIQKDKSAISEIHRAIEIAITDDAYLMAKKGTGTTATNGVITIADLFDKTDKASTDLAEEVGTTVGKTVKLTSKMREDCTVKVEVLDTSAGVVILSVSAPTSKQEFYIDSTGENEGKYTTTAAKKDK